MSFPWDSPAVRSRLIAKALAISIDNMWCDPLGASRMSRWFITGEFRMKFQFSRHAPWLAVGCLAVTVWMLFSRVSDLESSTAAMRYIVEQDQFTTVMAACNEKARQDELKIIFQESSRTSAALLRVDGYRRGLIKISTGGYFCEFDPIGSARVYLVDDNAHRGSGR